MKCLRMRQVLLTFPVNFNLQYTSPVYVDSGATLTMLVYGTGHSLVIPPKLKSSLHSSNLL